MRNTSYNQPHSLTVQRARVNSFKIETMFKYEMKFDEYDLLHVRVGAHLDLDLLAVHILE